ncbi:putative SET and MYND domain-containing protein 3 [Trypanosoma rangeli]|uniref:Putative SET and MYND domain-containing protein 3 n=1 Tax=Trypanosoma rangeli TaxID=5698 RepID=A0A3R7KV16_TRYRA|nr:putative SET and MYND domain-containing protein 3 [Trypanosoma rangeli]RNF01934.1 putative SET and MYND domain-containing protein 3 [Trypanosoma rangeli]|eukprot:RNF01934.1 putative SET and MYND domain-containing protein 3 [Trypanosoma rangeli]
MPTAPQDQLVGCVHFSDTASDAGRYAVAKADICPGELLLLAAPYVVAMNPNETPSAMHIVDKVDEWVDISEGPHPANASMAKRRKKNGFLLASMRKGYVPVSPFSTRCCNCLQGIAGGSLFLNYETIRWVSGNIAAEHAKHEEERWLKEGRGASQGRAVSVSPDEELAEGNDTGDEKQQQRKLQKPTKLTQMRSKGYMMLKKKLSEAAAHRRESEMLDYHVKAMQMENAKAASWPERVVEREVSLPEAVLNQGVCGCAGCGVVVYCSRVCWMEHHELHRTSGTCQTLRSVYPSLIKVFYVGGGTQSKSIGTKHASPDSWSTKHWLRRTGEDAAWEMQFLLLAALLVTRCAKEGFAAHMTEETNTISAKEKPGQGGEERREAACVATGQGATYSSPENEGQRIGGATSAELQITAATMPIARDSTAPYEAEVIRLARLQCGGAVEVMDPKALGEKTEAHSPESASHLYVSLQGHMTFGICGRNEATHVVRSPRWMDAARLVTNLSVVSKESRRKFRCSYRRFTKLVLPWLGADAGTEAGLTVTVDFFDRLCAAVQCNSFGLFDTDGNCIGVALYPEASYFNHSCSPNVCRVTCRGRLAAFYALRGIQKGEPLTICYVDVQETSTAERRRLLLSSYRFFCECERCRGATTAGPEIRLCDACVTRGYIAPVPPPAAACWGMDAVREGMCSVCQTRSPWNLR